MLHAILFDLWGTLIYDDFSSLLESLARRLGVATGALAAAFRATREEATLGRIPDVLQRVQLCCRDLGARLAREDLQRAVEEALADHRRGVRAYPDAAAVLQAVRRRGLAAGLVSNASATTDGVLEALGLDGFFDTVVFSHRVGMAKPDPRIYRLALARLGVEAGAALFVGDGANREIEGARAVGLRTVYVRRRPEVLPADHTVHELSELLPLLDTLAGSPAPPRLPEPARPPGGCREGRQRQESQGEHQG